MIPKARRDIRGGEASDMTTELMEIPAPVQEWRSARHKDEFAHVSRFARSSAIKH
jgi:hypothetical protein